MTESIKRAKPKLNNDPIALTDKSYMYYHRGIPYVPHYTQKGMFIGPGNTEKLEIELEVLGAIKKEAFLWPRYWMTEKSRMVR
jgi:hypothetical protein